MKLFYFPFLPVTNFGSFLLWLNDHKFTYLTKLKKKKHLAITTYLHQRLSPKFENKLESPSQKVHFKKQKPNNPIAPPIFKKKCNLQRLDVI
jgi:hypothetical protein